MKILLLALCLLTLFSVGLRAAQYRFLGWPESISGLYCEVGGSMVSAPIHFGSPSRYMNLAAGSDVTLYRENKNPAEGEPPYLPVASLPASSLPTESSIVLVVKVGDENYRMVAIDDNEQAYPEGSLVVCSLVPYQLAIKIEDEVYMISPMQVIVPERQAENQHSQIQVAGYRNSDSRVKFNTNILLRAGYRYFMFIQDSAVTPVPSRTEDVGLSVFFVSDFMRKPTFLPASR